MLKNYPITAEVLDPRNDEYIRDYIHENDDIHSIIYS